MDRRVLVITGPTATGKTALGVALAQKLGGEILSADSMQVYRRMDIGTAKVTPAEMRGVPHHLLDVAEPSEDYSAARWVAAAAEAAEAVFARGNIREVGKNARETIPLSWERLIPRVLERYQTVIDRCAEEGRE